MDRGHHVGSLTRTGESAGRRADGTVTSMTLGDPEDASMRRKAGGWIVIAAPPRAPSPGTCAVGLPLHQEPRSEGPAQPTRQSGRLDAIHHFDKDAWYPIQVGGDEVRDCNSRPAGDDQRGAMLAHHRQRLHQIPNRIRDVPGGGMVSEGNVLVLQKGQGVGSVKCDPAHVIPNPPPIP